MSISALLKKSLFAVTLCLFSVAFATADYNSAGIPDSVQIRRGIVSSWLNAPLRSLRNKAPELKTDDSGAVFKLTVEENDTEFIISLSPETFVNMTYIDGDKSETIRQSVFVKDSCGSWSLYRRKSDGEPIRIEMRFNNNPDVYIQFRPDGRRTYADLIVYNSYISRSVPIIIPFNNLYTTSFQTIKDLTSSSIPWQNVIPDLDQYDKVKTMIDIIRRKLPLVEFSKFAAYNEDGILYSIRTGEAIQTEEKDPILVPYEKDVDDKQEEKKNESLKLGSPGFVKWIIDGIIEPITGSGTNIQDMLVPTVQFDTLGKKGVISQSWNLTMNLDWVRNLAVKAMSTRSRLPDLTYKNAGVDVSIMPFAAYINVNGKILKNPGYMKDIGYNVYTLKSLFYVLSVTESGWFYIGAIRHSSSKKVDESVFDESASFFPYFDEQGKFNCVVFQSGHEMTLDEFLENNDSANVHLERVQATDIFIPQ